MSRALKPVPISQLKQWSTQRLLAYRTRLLELEDSIASSDMDEEDRAALEPELLYFKEDRRWKPLYDALLDELSRRQHVS